MVDRMEIYKSLNISILTVRRNSKMLKFVPEYVEKKKKKKKKKRCKHVVKRLSSVIRYLPEQ